MEGKKSQGHHGSRWWSFQPKPSTPPKPTLLKLQWIQTSNLHHITKSTQSTKNTFCLDSHCRTSLTMKATLVVILKAHQKKMRAKKVQKYLGRNLWHKEWVTWWPWLRWSKEEIATSLKNSLMLRSIASPVHWRKLKKKVHVDLPSSTVFTKSISQKEELCQKRKSKIKWSATCSLKSRRLVWVWTKGNTGSEGMMIVCICVFAFEGNYNSFANLM